MRSLLPALADAFRRLRRARTFSLFAVGVLALGIGATCALFALVKGVVLRPLPYADPGRLVVLVEDDARGDADNWPTSVERLREYGELGASAGRFAGVRPLDAVVTAGGEPERVPGVRATGNLFDVLGVKAARGRLLDERDARPEAPPAAVIGYGLWQRRFGGDPALLGRSLDIDGVAYTVVGVAPASFAWPRPTTEFWIPFVATERERNRGWYALRTVGRLAPGATIESATAALGGVAKSIAERFPETDKNRQPRLVPLLDEVLGSTRSSLQLLQGAVLLVLLVATANFSNLLLARGATREGELALRSALGSGRRALVRMQLAEGLVLGAAGSLAGIALGAGALRVALAAAGPALPRASEVALDSGVVGASILVALLAGAIGALLPAFAALGVAPAEVLRGSGKGVGLGRRRHWLAALVVLEVAAATALAAGGGLVARSVDELAAVDAGVDSAGVVTLEIAPPQRDGLAGAGGYIRRLVASAREAPELGAVSAISRLPVVGGTTSTSYQIDGRITAPELAPVGDLRYAEAGAMALLGVALEGEDFRSDAASDGPLVVLVNRAFARRQFPGGDAIGKRIWLATERDKWRTIVGVVGDVHFAELEKAVEPTIWVPFSQAGFPSALRVATVVAKSERPPAEALAALRRAITSFDALQAPTQARTLTEAIGSSLAPRRFQAGLLAAFATIAALLAAAGVYGVTAYAVAQRRRELGVRLALGADGPALARLVLAQGARLGGFGLALGLVGALASSRLLGRFLYGVRIWEPSVLASVAVTVGTTALVACMVPALRAYRTPPAQALRDA